MATIRKVGNKWKADIHRKVGGEVKRKSARFNTKGEAVSWAAKVERQILGGAVEYSKDLTFQDVCDKYEREISLKKKGARWESIRLAKICRDIGDKFLIDLTPRFWRDWIQTQLKTLSPSSVNRELNLLSSVFSHCVEWEFMEKNPLQGIRRPKNPKHRERRISASEEKAISEYLGTDPNTNKGQAGIAFLLALETGLRRGELLALRWSEIALKERYLLIVDSKNGDSRQVPLSSRAIALFGLISRDRERVFTVVPHNLTAVFRKACRELGIQDLTFHDTRHEAVSRLAKKLDVMSLARIIGHRDVRSLMVYYNPTASELASLLD